MSTIGRRGSTWTNSDGLVVGFGTQKPAINGAVQKNYGGVGGAKVATAVFDWKDLNANVAGGTTAGIHVPVPAGARVLNVRVVIGTAWTSTGTNTFEVGLTGGDVDGFLSTTVGTVANMTAGAVLNGDGVFLFGATDTGAAELYAFAAADTIDVVSGMTDWTAGTATLVVTYL
jgi:hypothetical protein